MNILAITPYTGSEKLVKMTEAMLHAFAVCAIEADATVTVVAMNNAASRPIGKGLADLHLHMEENVGFGNAINKAVDRTIIEPPKLKTVHIKSGKITPTPETVDVTDVLLLNNDLQFPDVKWLARLLAERDGKHVLSPCTDITATKAAIATEPRELAPILHHEVSAYCWLVPIALVHALRKKFGFNLFHPNFTNYGSDDVTAACLRSIVGKQPFKIVPRSFVRHLKAQTANELGIKAGDREVIGRIVNFKRARGLS